MKTACPHCGFANAYVPSLVGTDVKCAECRKTFTMRFARQGKTTGQSQSGDTKPQSPCPHCGFANPYVPSLVGTKVTCQGCQETFTMRFVNQGQGIPQGCLWAGAVVLILVGLVVGLFFWYVSLMSAWSPYQY